MVISILSLVSCDDKDVDDDDIIDDEGLYHIIFLIVSLI